MTSACPHCGGLNGFYRLERRQVTRLYDWSGQSMDADDERATSESGARCLDCDHPLQGVARALGNKEMPPG